jgi:hypothetical protein
LRADAEGERGRRDDVAALEPGRIDAFAEQQTSRRQAQFSAQGRRSRARF